MDKLGSIIKFYRKKNKLTQKELGALIDKKEITIRKYESGDISPPMDVLVTIGKALNVSIGDFFNFSLGAELDDNKNNYLILIDDILEEHGYKLVDAGGDELELINRNNYTSDMIDKNKLINFYKEENGNINFEDILMFTIREDIRKREAFTKFIETLGYYVTITEEANGAEGFAKITDNQYYFKMDVEDYEKLVKKMEKFINMELSDYEVDKDDFTED